MIKVKTTHCYRKSSNMEEMLIKVAEFYNSKEAMEHYQKELSYLKTRPLGGLDHGGHIELYNEKSSEVLSEAVIWKTKEVPTL